MEYKPETDGQSYFSYAFNEFEPTEDEKYEEAKSVIVKSVDTNAPKFWGLEVATPPLETPVTTRNRLLTLMNVIREIPAEIANNEINIANDKTFIRIDDEGEKSQNKIISTRPTVRLYGMYLNPEVKLKTLKQLELERDLVALTVRTFDNWKLEQDLIITGTNIKVAYFAIERAFFGINSGDFKTKVEDNFSQL